MYFDLSCETGGENNCEMKLCHVVGEKQKVGLVRMCRMGGEVECKEVSVAWVLDNNNKHIMAVRTEDGWREILVSVD